MKFDIYGRFQLEVLRDQDHWSVYRLASGKRMPVHDFIIPPEVEPNDIARELVDSTLGMIGGQFRDITGDDSDLASVHRLKTGRLFLAGVCMGLDVAGVSESERAPWLAFGDEVGLLFQVVDDLLDGDGYVERLGVEGAGRLAHESAERARAELDLVDADTSVLRELVDVLAVRTG